MPMPMGMWFCQIYPSLMLMLMVLIMGMCMCVFQWLVGVCVLVGLGQMKPHTQAHEC